jgi:hypothetical protein
MGVSKRPMKIESQLGSRSWGQTRIASLSARSIFARNRFGVKLRQQELQGIKRKGEAHRGDVASAGDEAGFDELGQQRAGRAFAQTGHLLELAVRGGAGEEEVVQRQRGVKADAFVVRGAEADQRLGAWAAEGTSAAN